MTASSTAIVTCGFRAHSVVFRHIAAVRPQVAILAIVLKQFDRKRAHVGFAGIEQPHSAFGLKRRAFVERGGAASPRFDGDERRISRSAPYAQVVKAVKRQPHAVAARRANEGDRAAGGSRSAAAAAKASGSAATNRSTGGNPWWSALQPL